jgi:hypothetical protein
MKIVVIILSCFILFFYLTSCSSGPYIVSANGDIADVELKSGQKFTSEIVSISDSVIYFASVPDNYLEPPILFYSLVNDIKSIEIQGYDGGSWFPSVLFWQVLPAGLLAGAAASVGNTSAVVVGSIFAIPALFTSVCFGATETQAPRWYSELPREEINSLKSYSRYPETIDKPLLNKLLLKYNQKSIKKYF